MPIFGIFMQSNCPFKTSFCKKTYISTIRPKKQKISNFWWFLMNFGGEGEVGTCFYFIILFFKQLQEKLIFWHSIVNFPDFQQNNTRIVQNNCTFKKYHSRGKFIFQQLISKNREFCQFLMKWCTYEKEIV